MAILRRQAQVGAGIAIAGVVLRLPRLPDPLTTGPRSGPRGRARLAPRRAQRLRAMVDRACSGPSRPRGRPRGRSARPPSSTTPSWSQRQRAPAATASRACGTAQLRTTEDVDDVERPACGDGLLERRGRPGSPSTSRSLGLTGTHSNPLDRGSGRPSATAGRGRSTRRPRRSAGSPEGRSIPGSSSTGAGPRPSWRSRRSRARARSSAVMDDILPWIVRRRIAIDTAGIRRSYCADAGRPGGDRPADAMCNPCVNPRGEVRARCWIRAAGRCGGGSAPCSRNAPWPPCLRPRSSSPPVRPGRRPPSAAAPSAAASVAAPSAAPPRPRARPPARQRARPGRASRPAADENAGTAVKIGGVTDVGRLDDKSFNEAGWCGTLKGGTAVERLVQGHRDQGQEGLPDEHEAAHRRGRQDHRDLWLRPRH